MYMCVLDSEVESQTEKLKFNLLLSHTNLEVTQSKWYFMAVVLVFCSLEIMG